MEKKNVHIGYEIMKELKKRNLSVSWLAMKTDDDASNLCKQLRGKYIKHEKLEKICKALKIDYFALYSQQVADDIQ